MSDLGVTLMHEHVFLMTTEIMQNYPEDWGRRRPSHGLTS